MQSPPAELVTDIFGCLVKNAIRGAGEADSDTISEQVRALVVRHPYGRPLLYLVTAAVAVGWVQHIDKPLRRA